MDWAPARYDASWGKAITGTLGGPGFGANFKYIVDNAGNVSWLLFTSPHLLADFKDVPVHRELIRSWMIRKLVHGLFIIGIKIIEKGLPILVL